MAKREKLPDHINELNIKLLSTLDENIFFKELGKFLSKSIPCSGLEIFLVDHYKRLDGSLFLKKNKDLIDSFSLVASNVLIKGRAYFCNDVSKDPLFLDIKADNINSSLIVPSIIEGVPIAVFCFYSYKQDKITYSEDDITDTLNILNTLNTPLTNMKMYLSVKNISKASNKNNLYLVEDKESSKNRKEFIYVSSLMKKIVKLAEKTFIDGKFMLVMGERGVGKVSLCEYINSVGENNILFVDCFSKKEDWLCKKIFEEHFYKGKIESLLLKNISSIPLSIQRKIASYLKLNSNNSFIFFCDSNDLQEKVERNEFDSQLYAILMECCIYIPPLRERLEDIDELSQYFLRIFNKQDKKRKFFSEWAINALKSYKLSGNTIQLKQIVREAFLTSTGDIIEKNNIRPEPVVVEKSDYNMLPLKNNFEVISLAELEKRYIHMALESLKGNKAKAARMLGITIKTLYNKINTYQLDTIKS